MKEAIRAFDAAIPDLRKMRNVLLPIDDYSLGDGRNKTVHRQLLEVG